MGRLVANYVGSPVHCKDVFLTHEYEQPEEMARNGFLHFDRNHALKFFIYLTDVDSEDDGPLYLQERSHKKGRKLRTDSWSKEQTYADIKNRLHIDYRLRTKEKPVLAKAGSLMIFDTDCFHKGGITKEGHERKIIRAHYGIETF
jgi:ectoine hydroxylase-related dioxygenase (phytanoyl-CoA dioxygenase family)